MSKEAYTRVKTELDKSMHYQAEEALGVREAYTSVKRGLS